MAVEGVCKHEDCHGWCYQKRHFIYGEEGKLGSVEQFGILYTMDGRRIPDEVPPAVRGRLTVPPHLSHLLVVDEPAADVQTLDQPPELDLELLSELDSLAEPDDEDTHETISLGRGVQQHQPRVDRSPVKIGR